MPRRLPRSITEPERADVPDRSERAMLVGVMLPATKADLNDPLGELAALTEAAGVRVVDAMMQKRLTMSTRFGLGKGKVEELTERAKANEADVVVFDNDLSPRQVRELEKAVGLKVIDRSELILDIFALRARTREAQLQVELAQLEYTAPRLRGMWTHLERIAGTGGATAAGAVGGVGTRGPGERQIEIDRRIVKKRISQLKREIADIDRRKQREVGSRRDEFTVALVGYTNSGKSTLMNRLTNSKRFAADQLFATLDTKTARWDLGEGRSVLLSDTVGFIRDLPPGLVASFRATLEETIHADLLLHVVDVSSSTTFAQMEAVDEVLVSLGCQDLPQIALLNKIDIVNDTSMTELLARHRSRSLCISALTGEGLDKLTQEVSERMKRDSAEVTVRIPQREGKLIAEIDHRAEVLDRRYLNAVVELDIRINRTHLRQLAGRNPAMTILRGEIEAPDEPDPDEFA